MGFLFKERNEKMNSDRPAINAVRERVANQPVLSHVERMQVEAIELSIKIEKLSAFLSTPTYQALPVHDRCLLIAQHQAMSTYRTILELRITSATSATEYQSTARQDDASGEILGDGVRFAKPEDPEPIPFA